MTFRSGKFWFLIMALFLLSGCEPSPNADYDPDENTPTHEEMFKEFFGVEHDQNSVGEIFAFSKPPPLLGIGLNIIWFMAAFSLIVIIIVGGIKSTLQAPTSKSLLGNDISTPIAPVRLGLAFFLIMTIPGAGNYSMIESIILSANKYVSNQANKLYTSQVELYKDEYIYKTACQDANGTSTCPEGADDGSQKINLAFSDAEYFRLFQVALCMQYAEAEGLNNLAEEQSLDAERKYNDGSTFTNIKGTRYNMTIENGGFLWSDAPIEGGCGQWYTYVQPPEGVNISASKPSEIPSFDTPEGPINSIISQELQASVQSTSLHVRSAWGMFKALAKRMIMYKEDSGSLPMCGSSPGDPMSCEQWFSNKFHQIVNEHNKLISNSVNSSYNNVIGSEFITAINTDAIDVAKKHGWFFAGALPYMFASSAERLNAFDGIKLMTSIPALNQFPDEHTEKLHDYYEYTESVLGSSSSLINAGMLPTGELSDGFFRSYTSCVGLSMRVVDCIGNVAALETLALTQVFASGVSHPLTVTHRIGKSGADSSFDAIVGLRILQAATNVMSSIFVGTWSTPMFQAIKGGVDISVESTTPFLEYLMITYTFLGYFVVLMPFVYFSIAIVSYVITLFVSVLAGNFFAVSHAWLEGQGMVSSYAQRGYPSLIFSALTPILIVLVFFIYLYTMPFMFKFLGYSYNLFLTPFMSRGMPGVFGGLFFFTMLLVMIIAIHRVWAKLILTIPDRVMRLIGVHEALTQNDFSQDIEQGGHGAAGKIAGSASAAASMTGGAISGNAGQTQSVIDNDPNADKPTGGGGVPSGGDTQKSADSGEGSGRDTSGYKQAGGEGGKRFQPNPQATGVGHSIAAGVKAGMANRKAKQGADGSQETPTGKDGGSGGTGSSQATDNQKSQDSASQKDAGLRNEAGGANQTIGNKPANVTSGPAGYGNINTDKLNSSDMKADVSEQDKDLRGQVNTDLDKTNITKKDGGIPEEITVTKTNQSNDEGIKNVTNLDKTDDSNKTNKTRRASSQDNDKNLRDEVNKQSDLSDSDKDK